MNAMTTFTLKSLRANKVRTLVTIAGVALAAALLTAVLTSYTSLMDMMYRGEAHSGGTWQAQVQSNNLNQLEDEAKEALDSGAITTFAALENVGFGQLTDEQKNQIGYYLPIANITGDVEQICAIRPSEGRLPQAPGEILLSSIWQQTDQPVKLGDTLTLPVGQRQAVEVDDESPSVDQTQWRSAEDAQRRSTIEAGSLLDSSIGYLNAALDGGSLNEQLTNLQERTFTVVGFYNDVNYCSNTNVGLMAFTCGETPLEGMTAFGYATLDDASSSAQIEERIEGAFPTSPVTRLHTAMLRYMGINTGGAIWDTFYGIMTILAAVIIVSCVSLIYNAFAISVAERSGQFGLLASVGASRGQLRRAVVTEALAVALVGIPLGLLVGIGGCAVTFYFLGDGIATLFSGNSTVPFRLAVEPMVLAAVLALTLVTVLFSVFVPAWRASRTNIIDALRGRQSRRASKKGEKRAARATGPSQLWRQRGIAGRVFGIGGALARTNRKRGSSKGTAASVSLALAIVLLMTAGSLSTFLGTLADVASGGGMPEGDVAVSAGFMSPSEAKRQNLRNGSYDAQTATQPATAQEAAEVAQARFAQQTTIFAEAYKALSAVPDAEAIGWRLDSFAPVSMDASMVSSHLVAENGETSLASGGVAENGKFNTHALFVYLDDAAFDAYARQLGQNPSDYYNPDHPRAIAIGRAYGNNGISYTLIDTVTNTGTVQVTLAGVYKGRVVDGFAVGGRNENGDLTREITPYFISDDDSQPSVSDDEMLAGTQVATTDVEIAAIADEAPAALGGGGEGVQLVLPMSMASSHAFFLHDPSFHGLFNTPEGESAEVAQALIDRLGDTLADQDQFTVSFLYMNDYATGLNQNQIMATVVNVFCLLFTVILALIAMANVFNTVTNGLILRQREFAVMRSIGLANRQFRRMIASECATWCLRGLIPGSLISLAVAYLLYQQVAGSLKGLAFFLPWSYVALAAALTACTILASVAYGMHRCKAANLVEALRTDSV
ncbi:ABC transporter permease [Parvibacter caecicola]|uniref:ABC transporter permease n=1 Tax=Parvibacter caecicola TaxID=747645 RepID=UPI002730882C|nr:ABC transporter permease [Parvibacter caecicola]